MKKLQGKSFNIDRDILGKITLTGKTIFQRSNYILVKKNVTKLDMGYLATITENDTDIQKRSTILLKDLEYSEFQEGDVVLINQHGEVVFLYEIMSNHNAIMTTERCNHRCIMCPQPPISQENDKTDFNLKLLSLFDKNTKEIGITGGEPTLIGDKLFTLIKYIQKSTPGAAISLLSNGVKYADKEYAMKLAMCKHSDLQIDVPIFSDIADEHNKIVGANTFYKTIQGIYNLALFHQRIGLRIVVHRLTYKRLPQLADFIYHNFPFVSQVAFMEMETTGLAGKNIQDLWIDPFNYRDQLREAVLFLSNRGVNTYIYNAQLCVLPEDIRPFAQQSISDWKDIYLQECNGCKLKGQCGGFFESNRKYHSSHICNVESISCDILS